MATRSTLCAFASAFSPVHRLDMNATLVLKAY